MVEVLEAEVCGFFWLPDLKDVLLFWGFPREQHSERQQLSMLSFGASHLPEQSYQCYQQLVASRNAAPKGFPSGLAVTNLVNAHETSPPVEGLKGSPQTTLKVNQV